MKYIAQCTLLGVLCLFSQGDEARASVCDGDYACVDEAPAGPAALPDQPALAKLARFANFAGPERCLSVAVDVTASSAEERRLACSAAIDALQMLNRCGISLRRPVDVRIMREVRHPFNGAILGLFDVKQESVLITQEANVPSLVKDTPAAKLPLRDFYRSLIVHEVVHGVMHQNLKGQLTSHAASEYPAYALQIESLPPDVRDRFLWSFNQTAIKADAFLFNDVVLHADPFLFAASVYEHFKAEGNGCEHLQALLDGEARFIATLPAGW